MLSAYFPVCQSSSPFWCSAWNNFLAQEFLFQRVNATRSVPWFTTRIAAPSSAINPRRDLVLWRWCSLCLVNMGKTQCHTWPRGALNMWAGSLWHVWDHQRCHIVCMITHAEWSVCRLCTVFSMVYNRIEPIVWALLVSSITHVEIQARKSSYYVFILDQRLILLYHWRKIIWINWTFPWKPGLIYLPHAGQLPS